MVIYALTCMENNRLFTLVITLISISIGPARPMPSNKNLWQDGTYPKWLMEKLCVCFGYCSESLGNQTKEGAADESRLERGKTWGELPSPSSTMGARNLMRLKTGMTLKD